MRNPVPKDTHHAAASQRGQYRPSPIYCEYFADLLPFDGHAVHPDTLAAPPPPAAEGGTADGKAQAVSARRGFPTGNG